MKQRSDRGYQTINIVEALAVEVSKTKGTMNLRSICLKPNALWNNNHCFMSLFPKLLRVFIGT